jgi:hypothetical protein
MKCTCGAEIASDSGSGLCGFCGARKPYAWVCANCNQEVAWDHPTELVCSTVCPKCKEPKPASQPSPLFIRPTAWLPNCSPFGQFALLVGAIFSLLGCVFAVVAAVFSLLEGHWVIALVQWPFFFVLQAAVFVVFLRVRALGK